MSTICTSTLGLLLCMHSLPTTPHRVATQRRSSQQRVELLTQDALRSLGSLETRAARLRPGDVRGANALMRRLSIVANKINGAKDKRHPKWREARKRYGELVTLIRNTANNKPVSNKGIAGLKKHAYETYEALRKSQLSSMGDPATVAKWRRELTALSQQLNAMPDKSSRDYGKAKAQVDQIHRLLERGIASFRAKQSAAKQQAGIDAVLLPLQEKYGSKHFPRKLYAPLELTSTKQWAARVGRLLGDAPANGEIAADLAKVQALRKVPQATATRQAKQRLASMERWIGVDTVRRLRERVDQATELVDSYVKNGQEAASFLMKTDITDPQQVTTRLLGEGSFDNYMARLKDGLRYIEIARAFDAGLHRTAKRSLERKAQEERIRRAMKHLEQLAELAIHAIHMPPAQSKDAKLLAAAIAALKKSGHARHERIVINFDVKDYDQWRGSARLDSSVIRTSSFHYIWREFQATTAEKEGDNYWLYANRFKFYKSADPQTRTGVWYLSQRFKTTRILKENIAK